MISSLMSLMVDQVCRLQAHGVCAAILSGNTRVSKVLLATERDNAQGKLRFLFTAPGAIVGNSRWKQILLELSDSGSHCVYKSVRTHFPRTLSVNIYIIVRYLWCIIQKINSSFHACTRSSPQAFPPSPERPGNEAMLLYTATYMLYTAMR